MRSAEAVLLRIFRLVKLLRLFRVSRLLHRYQNQLIYYHSFISVARVNGLVILIAHWMGCIYGMNYEQNLDDNSSNRWLQSIYWACSPSPALATETCLRITKLPCSSPYSPCLWASCCVAGS